MAVGGGRVPSLQFLAASAVAENPSLLAEEDISSLPEEMALLILFLLIKKLKLTPALIKVFRGTHAAIDTILEGFDEFPAISPHGNSSCRVSGGAGPGK